MTYEAKAIGSGSEGAQSTLQVSRDDPCTSTLHVVSCMMGLMTCENARDTSHLEPPLKACLHALDKSGRLVKQCIATPLNIKVGLHGQMFHLSAMVTLEGAVKLAE